MDDLNSNIDYALKHAFQSSRPHYVVKRLDAIDTYTVMDLDELRQHGLEPDSECVVYDTRDK